MKSAEAHAKVSEQAAAILAALTPDLQAVASMLALAVRNEIEDLHAAGTAETIKNTDDHSTDRSYGRISERVNGLAFVLNKEQANYMAYGCSAARVHQASDPKKPG